MQNRNRVSRFQTRGGLLRFMAFVVLLFLSLRTSAANILLYRGPSSDSYNDNAANELAALLIAGGNTVTQVQKSAGQCPTETWGAPYDQVWDFRFAQLAGCPGGGNFDDFSACWQTKATNYLNNCGKLFLLGENSAYGGRNTNLVAYLNTIGATNGFGACPDWSTANNKNNMEDDRVGLMNLNTPLPNGATQYVSYAMGGMPVGPAGFNVLNPAATDFADWGPATGEQWNNGDNNTRSVAAGWAGSAALPGTGGSACSVGKLFMTWDQSAFDNGSMYVGANKTITDNFFKGVAQWLGTAPCVCSTPSNTPSRTLTRTSTLTLTATPTFSPTLTMTRSSSPTSTFTVTFTPSSTLTRTPTPSPTLTATLTATPSVTLTRSPTQTPTSTFSVTATPSFTLTRTPTQTPTSTYTATLSSTSTLTRTPTATLTFSPTLSSTPTSTLTKSPTVTITFLDTYTYSPTVTPTRTFTSTLTATRTETLTSTPTLSDTSTRTSTQTKTETPTATVSFSFTATPSFTPTFSMTPSFTNTSQFTATNTPTVTATSSVTLSSTSTSTRTLSSTPSHSSTVTFTRTHTSTSTYTRTLTPSSTLTPSVTVTITVTSSPSFTDSPTITATPIPMPDQLKIMLYNAAGEKVRDLFDGTAQFIPSSISLNSYLLAAGSGVSVGLDLQGAQTSGKGSLSWAGENNGGQIVDGGMYYFKLEFTDTFGTVTAMTKSINVIRMVGETTLEVFNSAGEMVASKNLSVQAPGAVDFNPEGSAFSPSNDPNAALSSANSMRFDIKKASGGASTWDWDGRNSQGAVVASGTYSVRLSSTQSSGAKMVVLRSVTVLKNGLDLADPAPYVAENPLGIGKAIELRYTPRPGARVFARLDNLAGELIAQASADAGQGSLKLPAMDLAGGVYLIEFEVRDGQALSYRKIIKCAISR